MPFTAEEIARQTQGTVVGDPSTLLTGFAPAHAAKPGDLTFAETEAYFARADQSAASAILVDKPYGPSSKILIRVPHARIAFARILGLFFPEPVFPPGIHPTAVVAPTAQIHPTAHIGPGCVIEDHVTIQARTALVALVTVGAHSTIDEDSRIFPSVTLYPKSQIGKRVRIHAGTVVGSDGYGYVLDEGQHRKVPQIGWVIIQDDVELGANVTVDRGALGPTLIGRGSKIDNLVQVGHNVVLGEHCLLVAQVGVAGSTQLGNYVTVAGQAGIVGHLKVADRAIIGGQAGVTGDIPAGETWLGSPARPARLMKRQFAALDRLPDLLKRVAQLERQLAALTPTTSPPSTPPADPP